MIIDKHKMLLTDLFTILETHFNITSDIIQVIPILREVDISDWRDYVILQDNINTFRIKRIFINDKFKVSIVIWPKNNNAKFRHLDSVFKILQGEMTIRHIKSTDNECNLENAFNTRYTGYMTSINNMEPYVYKKTKQFQYMYVLFFKK